jgi:hypothetical protein
MREFLSQQPAFEIEARIKGIKAIAVVPLTREEFEKTNQGMALSKVPRVGIERAGSVVKPRTLDDWSAVTAGKVKEERGNLWKEVGWGYGANDAKSPRSRGPLYGLKVVEVVRMVAGPMIGMQLAQLGADVLRVNSADIIDYPTYGRLQTRTFVWSNRN